MIFVQGVRLVLGVPIKTYHAIVIAACMWSLSGNVLSTALSVFHEHIECWSSSSSALNMCLSFAAIYLDSEEPLR